MIGQSIGHYKILEKLGAGGMGEVYRAEDKRLKREIALKVLAPELAGSQKRLERFQREAETLAALDHPNIVHIYTVEEADGTRFLTMQLVDGKRLSQVIPKGGMSLEKIFEVAVPLADALSAAHEKGVIHRDLKPSNIMLTSDGRVKVLDFGLAKLVPEASDAVDTEMPTEPLTDEGRILGTIPYLSPEQLDGAALDARTDIFSLGVILYELATGERPFKGDKSASVISAIMRDDPVDADSVREDLPHHLGRIITQCLEKDPEDRYQSVKDVRNELKSLNKEIESDVISSGRVIVPPPTPATRWRWPLVVAAGIVVVALLLSLLLGGEFRSIPPKITERDKLVLTDFVNTTGDPVFDDTLKQALAVKLQESPYLNLLPERQVQETLRLMNRPADERVTPEIGLEICERWRIKAMVTGAISSLGTNYVITLGAVDCQTGESLAAKQFEVSSKEEVLSVVGRGAVEIRRELGESLATIEQYDAPIQLATTSSLEAFKAFSLGVAERAKGGDRPSIPYFERAIELDPSFAMAYGRLGAIYGNLGERDKSIQYRTEAYGLRERVSEFERLYIMAHYYDQVLGDLDRAVEAYELWKRTYSRHWTPYNNLADYYNDIGEFEKALVEGREALRLEPDHVFPYFKVAWAYFNLGRYDESKALGQQALEKGLDSLNLRWKLHAIAVIEGDEAARQQHFDSQAGTFGEAYLLDQQAIFASNEGRMRDSRSLVTQAVEVALRFDLPEYAAWMLADAAIREALLGFSEQAAEHVDQARGIAHSYYSVRAAALALGLLGDRDDVEALVQEMRDRFPDDTLVRALAIPEAQAALALERGHGEQAIKLLESGRPYELGFLETILLRGRGYLVAGDTAEATSEFQRVLNHPAIWTFYPIHALAQLELARAYRQSGMHNQSRKAYQDFFGLWERADEEVPIYQEAKAEYRGLESGV